MSDTDIPGNTGELVALATQLRNAADTVQTVKVGVIDDLSDWTGTGATAFRGVLEQFTPAFERADDALAYGSTAISRFADELVGFQTSAANYGREIDASQEALDNANARREAAEQAVEREIRAAAHNPLHAISVALDAARWELDEASALVDRCTLDLDDWLSSACANYSAYQNAVRACAAAINDLIGTSSTIAIHNGDIHIQPIGDGTLNLGARITKAMASDLSGDASPPSAGANPSPSAESAIQWAHNQLNSGNWNEACLGFVTAAYAQRPGPEINLNDSLEPHGEFDVATGQDFPNQFWDSIKPGAGQLHPSTNTTTGTWGSIVAANAGLKGNATAAPPPGALVFFQSPGGEPGHVVLSLGNGNLVSTPDGWGDHNGYKGVVHPETMSDHPASTYIGWWLPSQ
jgi:uncharacterized protein YukE